MRFTFSGWFWLLMLLVLLALILWFYLRSGPASALVPPRISDEIHYTPQQSAAEAL